MGTPAGLGRNGPLGWPTPSTVVRMDDEIVADDKNWTWVLDRRCDDCGFDASTFDASISGMAVRDLAVRWWAVLAGKGVAMRPRLGVWSPLEYGCHVRDVFRKFDERLRLMLDENEPHFENWDQDRTAVEERYSEQDPSVVSVQLIGAAASLASRFDSVGGAQWSRTGVRSDGSAFTVRSIAKYLMHDPVHHLALARDVEVSDPEDRAMLELDVAAEPWFGVVR